MPPFARLNSDTYISINYSDHTPRHIHVVKKGDTIARMAFDKDGFVKHLNKPNKDFKNSDFKVLKVWMRDNIEVLNDNWDRAENKEQLIDLGEVR